jgi:hypothetical protein
MTDWLPLPHVTPSAAAAQARDVGWPLAVLSIQRYCSAGSRERAGWWRYALGWVATAAASRGWDKKGGGVGTRRARGGTRTLPRRGGRVSTG